MEIRITPFSNLTPLTKTSVKDNQYSYSSKKTLATKNTRQLVISEQKINKHPRVIKTTSNMIQPPAVADKKGVLLYQQIEGNKLFSDGSELINRIQIKV